MLDGCDVPGATITTTTSGFMNTGLFIKWLMDFAAYVPTSIMRPLLLVMDGCSSHYSVEVIEAATKAEVLLVCLPENGTHLLQPLDVACFSTLKKNRRKGTREFMFATGASTIPAGKAIAIGSSAWLDSRIMEHMAKGFNTTGLFPLSLVAMRRRLGLFKGNGAAQTIAKWLKYKKEVLENVLVLPCPQVTTSKRKGVDVGDRILTKELLQSASAKASWLRRPELRVSRRQRNRLQERSMMKK